MNNTMLSAIIEAIKEFREPAKRLKPITEPKPSPAFNDGIVLALTEMALVGFSFSEISLVMDSMVFTDDEIIEALTRMGGEDPEKWPSYCKKVFDAWKLSND